MIDDDDTEWFIGPQTPEDKAAWEQMGERQRQAAVQLVRTAYNFARWCYVFSAPQALDEDSAETIIHTRAAEAVNRQLGGQYDNDELRERFRRLLCSLLQPVDPVLWVEFVEWKRQHGQELI